ncbi:MAG: hypothetical protein ACREJC_00645 [Tepidisphaeraceae bacterium]
MKPMWLLALGIGPLAIGCARTPKDYLSEPSGITIEQAMEQVTDGFQKMVSRRMQGEEEGVYQQLGLHVAEVTITFNVCGSSTSQGKLFVDLAAASNSSPYGAGRIGGETGTAETASRGNQITVHFVNLLFAPNSVVAGAIDPHDLHRLRYAVMGKDPGPRGVFSDNAAPTNASMTASAAGAAPPAALPDLPPIATAARDQSRSDTSVGESSAVRDILRQKDAQKPLFKPATQPTTQPQSPPKREVAPTTQPETNSAAPNSSSHR